MKQTKLLIICILVFLISTLSIATSNNSDDNNAEIPKHNYIIKFKDNSNKALIIQQEGEQYKLKHEFKKVPFSLIEATDTEINDLKKNPEVESVEPDQELELFGSEQTISWGINKVNAPNLWSEVTGKNVKIGIIDSGISNHDDLIVVDGVSFIENTSYFDDELGHGTSIAGVIGAQNNEIGIVGVAPDSELYSVKVIDSVGKLSDLLKGIEWSIENEVDIIMISLGVAEDSLALRVLVDEAYLNGILVVAASGRDGQLYYPGKYSSVIAVGSVDEDNNLGSDTGNGEELEFVAPGENILSTNILNSYEFFSGTSMAAPHVAGVAALLKEKYPFYTPNELRAKLQRDAVDLGEAGKDNSFGYGLVYADIGEENLGATIQIVFPEETDETKKEELEINPIKVEIVKIDGETETVVQTLFYDGNQGTQNISVEAGRYEVKQYFDDQVYSNEYNVSGGDLVVVPLHKVNPPVHQWLVYQAKYIWSTSEINSYLPSIWSNNPAVLDNSWILYGTRMEDDEIDNIQYLGCYPPGEGGNHPYCNHFWDPDGGTEDGLYVCWNQLSEGIGCTRVQWDSNYRRAQTLWDTKVIPYYNSGNINLAYYWLGRISHLLGDMGVPAHTHKDVHVIESYENYMAEYDDDIVNDYNYKQWTATGFATSTSTLYNLFYDMAETSDNFDSNDADGEFASHYEGHNSAWEWQNGLFGLYDTSYAEAKIHGNTLMPETMKHIAGLYQLFWKSVDRDGDGYNNYYDSCYTEGYSNLPSDTVCRDNYLAANGCHAYTNYGSSTLANPTPQCSTGTGDNNYNTGGEYLCAGYCDGSGNADYAGSCVYDAGCDPDDDNDGVLDTSDTCPTIAGTAEYKGCSESYAPKSVQASASGSQITLQWTPLTGASISKYNVYYSNTLTGFNFAVPNAVVNHPITTWTDTAPPAERYYTVRAVDTNNNEENNQNKIGIFNTSLVKSATTGVNAISLFFNVSGKNAENICTQISSVDTITKWDANTQLYSGHPCGTPVNNFNLEQGKGYFISVTGNTTYVMNGLIPSHVNINLIKSPTTGVNAVSLPVDSTLTSAEQICTNISNADTVTKWDASNQIYSGHPCGTPINNFNLVRGQGYFVSVTANTEWTQT